MTEVSASQTKKRHRGRRAQRACALRMYKKARQSRRSLQIPAESLVGADDCQEQHGLQIVQQHGLHICSWIRLYTVCFFECIDPVAQVYSSYYELSEH